MQGDLNELADAAEAALPSRFAGAWIENEPQYGLVVRLTGQGPGGAQLDAITSTSPVPTTVLTGATYTLQQLIAALDRVVPVLDSVASNSSAEVDVKSGSIVLRSRTGLPTDVVASLEATAGVPIQGVTTLDPAPALLHTYGGRKVTFNGTSACTTGFSVRNSGTGVYGVTTAGHCGNSGIVYYQTSSTYYSMTFMGERWDDDQDAQWMTGSHTVYPEFWDGSSYRYVTGTESVSNMLGDYVCHYGITSGYSCGTITSTNFSPGSFCGPSPGNYPCYPSWIKISTSGSLFCNHGDSGGPVFLLGVAYGTTVSGSFNPNTGECSWMSFMQTGYLNLMGLQVYVHAG